MTNYLSILTRRIAGATPQSAPLPGALPNNAGGYAFPLNDWCRLERFILLGSEGGSYYAGEAVLTRDNATAVLRAIAAEGGSSRQRRSSLADKEPAEGDCGNRALQSPCIRRISSAYCG